MKLNLTIQKNEHRLLALMLFCLLAVNWPGNSLQVGQGFLIAHFGFFLLWQPVVKQEQNFGLLQLIVLSCLVVSFIYWFNPWLYAFWTLLLLTLLSGRIFARGMARTAYAIAVITLFLNLVLAIVPQLFSLGALSSTLQQPFHLVLFAPVSLLLFIPSTEHGSRSIDLLRGFLFVLLLTFLLMGSVLISLVSHRPYLASLVISISLLSGFLLLIAFLWSPRSGFGGLVSLWEKYLLNIGGPFEHWLQHIDSLAAEPGLSAESFLSAASRFMLQQHWVCGVAWKTGGQWHNEGKHSANSVAVDSEQLALKLFSHTPVGPVLLLHAKLQLNVLAFYYRAKRQEQLLIRQAHMRAIYETGSKLTHDVKNILQSTRTMSQIINNSDEDNEEILAILKRQMPLLTQRLNTTLEKLRTPGEDEAVVNSGSLFSWWQHLQSKYAGQGIKFSAETGIDHEIPVDVFNTISENLLENAKNKRNREPGLLIEARLIADDRQIALQVTDSGSMVAPDIANILFTEVVASHDGFGIGLYQCYQLARKHGYQLILENNEDGNVVFTLKKPEERPGSAE